ncbi:MAG: hypothetical protein ABI793_06290 [Flavobacterium sp.]
MNPTKKLICIAFITSIISACNNKKPEPVVEKNTSKTDITLQIPKNEESIAGIYETQPDPNSTGDCKISVEIIKMKNGYRYSFITKSRKLKGKALFTNQSGEKNIVLEGIKWDEYDEDISYEDETDSITDSRIEPKEFEIPVGIDASYVKDTLTIQNYGNAMNSYTKISECDRKYIQLIKK